MAQTVTTTYADPGPVASGTPQAVGVQSLAWKSQETVSSSSGPGTNTLDVHAVDSESETSPNQTTQTTSDATFQYPAGGTGDVYLTSSTSVNGTPGLATSNTTTATTYGSGNGLVDILPETTGRTWSNDGALKESETDPGGRTAAKTVAAGGPYTSTATSPVLGGGSGVTTRSISDDADGSGTYVQTDLLGAPIATVSYAAPAGGSVVITLVTPTSSSGASPAPSPTPMTTTVPVWYALPVVLYAENDAVVGPTAVPGSCALPANFPTTATEVDHTATITDTVLGTIETRARKTYDVAGTVLCMQSSDTYAAYYDYSGANVALINFFGTNWQTTVTTQTLALTAANPAPASPATLRSQSTARSPQSLVARPLPVAFDAAVAKVRRNRERDVEAALSRKEIR